MVKKYMVDSHDLLTVLQTVLDTNNKNTQYPFK